MEVTASELGGCTVAKVAGRLDAIAAPLLDRRCDELIKAGARKLVLDLSALEYVSSAGLRSFLAALKKLAPLGGSLALASPAGVVEEVLGIAGFDTLLPIRKSVEEAVRAL